MHILFVTMLYFIVSTCSARPSALQQVNFGEMYDHSASPQNVITVPPNCPPGQEWVNGQCRDVWKLYDSKNMITVPPNCPPGQVYVNGYCRDVWRSSNAVDNLFANLRKIVTKTEDLVQNSEKPISKSGSESRSVITVPNQCPEGYKPDALGYCREKIDW